MRFLSRFGSQRGLTPAQAAADSELLLIDVREPAEYRSGHATGATNVPLASLDDYLGELSAGGKPIAFICQSGARSSRATATAERSGLHARNVAGGMLAWQRAGLPVETGSGNRAARRAMRSRER